MHFDIFTLFPDMFQGPFSESILKRAQEQGLLSVALHDIRDATTDKHHIVGGPIILLSPQGRLFNQQIARTLAQETRVTLICGHYEGVDERVREHLVTDELSIGDYVLTGGELAAMVVVDATSRLIPGVLGGAESILEESHSGGMLEYPHYTRPTEFRGWRVPDVLLSGNHAEIARWRRKESLKRTRERRPDLFEKLDLSSKQDVKLLRELEEGGNSGTP